MVFIYKKKFVKNIISIYNTNRLKLIRLHNIKYLYNNKYVFSSRKYLLLYNNIYVYKFNIWNFYTYSNALIINEFLIFYTSNYLFDSNVITNLSKNAIAMQTLLINYNNIKYIVYKNYNINIMWHYNLISNIITKLSI